MFWHIACTEWTSLISCLTLGMDFRGVLPGNFISCHVFCHKWLSDQCHQGQTGLFMKYLAWARPMSDWHLSGSRRQHKEEMAKSLIRISNCLVSHVTIPLNLDKSSSRGIQDFIQEISGRSTSIYWGFRRSYFVIPTMACCVLSSSVLDPKPMGYGPGYGKDFYIILIKKRNVLRRYNFKGLKYVRWLGLSLPHFIPMLKYIWEITLCIGVREKQSRRPGDHVPPPPLKLL